MAHRILYINYWNLNEPLTSAATMPYIRELVQRSDVDNVTLVTIEWPGKGLPKTKFDIPKVDIIQFHPINSLGRIISKVDMLIRLPIYLQYLIYKRKVNLVIAKASTSGALAHLATRINRCSYIVESYEPHSDYMRYCGIWNRYSPEYIFSKVLEKLQLKGAKVIVTVTQNYKNDLLGEGVDPGKVLVVPSVTDIQLFKFDPAQRISTRARLKIPMDAVVGIYVGKFGGLYYDHRAFVIFKKAFEIFPDLHLIIVSVSDHLMIADRLDEHGIDKKRITITRLEQGQIPDHLSASDFAFSTIRDAPINKYQCPVKNGEYWANGLPILMTDGVADDHYLLRKGIGGSVYSPDLSDLDTAFAQIMRLVNDPNSRDEIMHLAEIHKSNEQIPKMYEVILNDLRTEGQ